MLREMVEEIKMFYILVPLRTLFLCVCILHWGPKIM